jgi:hypothetical protein
MYIVHKVIDRPVFVVVMLFISKSCILGQNVLYLRAERPLALQDKVEKP